VVVILAPDHLIICIVRRSLNIDVNVIIKMMPLGGASSEHAMILSILNLLSHIALYLAIGSYSRIIKHFLA
jgi:hypothetical protein